MDPNSGALLGRTTALKQKWPGLQVWISVGGWAFTDPGPTREAFSNMVSTESNRQAFISALLQFMATYGFDGVDLDWEYPQADDRGGQPADTENYATLARELKAALGSKGLSMTLPTSYWYLQRTLSRHRSSFVLELICHQISTSSSFKSLSIGSTSWPMTVSKDWKRCCVAVLIVGSC